MIAGFVGNIGSGKTLSMVREAYNLHLQGKTVYSNFALNFPHETYTVEDLADWATGKKKLMDIVLLMDEAHIYLDSRTSVKSRNKIITYLLLQTRKLNCDVFFTTQFIGQVDIRLRNLTTHIVECITKKQNDVLTMTLNLVHTKQGNGEVTTKKYTFHANSYFKLYDTNEIISVD